MIDLSPVPLTATLPGVGAPGRPASSTTAAAAECVQSVFGGLAWVYRQGVAEVLALVPPAGWADPAQQGWQRVKENARREVWRAVIAGRPYYLKYYFRDSWLRRLRYLFREPACRAEWEGGAYALCAGVAATRPVAYTRGLRRGRRCCDLLVSEALEPALPLSEFWLRLQADEDARRRRQDKEQLIEILAELIARAHQSGFAHLDMHAANILVQAIAPRRYRAAFVDLQSTRRGAPLGDPAVVRNLAQLNQWFRKHASIGDRLRFLRAYLRWRNEYEPVFEHGRPLRLTFRGLVAALQIAAQRHAARLWAQRDRRAARAGRYFCRLRLPGGWRGLAVTWCKHATDVSPASHLEFTRAWWCRQLQEPLARFDSAVTSACKESHSGLVRRTLLEHERGAVPVIIKRPRARNWRRRLAQLLPPSRSLRGWRMGHALLHRDLPAARPLAVLERRLGPLVLDSLLVTEAVPGGVDLETFLKREHQTCSPAAWFALKRELGSLLAMQLRRLAERGFEHRDCKASNILVVPYPRLALLWIDMDGLRRCTASRSRSLQALVRLHVSLLGVPGLTRTDRVRVLKLYLTRYVSAPRAWRAVWPALTHASARKVQAKQVRRAWKLRHYGRE